MVNLKFGNTGKDNTFMSKVEINFLLFFNLLEADMIEAVSGHGKEKYRFTFLYITRHGLCIQNVDHVFCCF